MNTYVRFQTPLRCGETGRPLGIFHAAGRVEDLSDLPDVTRHWLRGALRWFNENLTLPRRNDGERRSIFWFRADSQPVIARVWELIAILQDEGISVYMQRTSKPGRIIYQDDHQIAAIPNGVRHRTCWVA